MIVAWKKSLVEGAGQVGKGLKHEHTDVGERSSGVRKEMEIQTRKTE